MKTRIIDIAERANVSVATVSNALAGRTGVSNEVSKNIRQIAAEMGYEGRRSNHSKVSAYVRLVLFKRHGMVVGNTQFFAELTEGIERQCQEMGLELIVTNIGLERDQDWQERIFALCRETCRGILLLGTEMEDEDLLLFSGCRSPLVVMDNPFRHQACNTVVMDNYDAGYRATARLLQAGHTHIGHITSKIEFNNIRYRRKGWEAMLKLKGLEYNENNLWRVRPTIEGAYADMTAFLEDGRPLPTAFFAGNDIMAIGCIRALQEKGYSVPQDISFIGMDDLDICRASTPQLTTIRVYRQEMGRTAVNILLNVIPQVKNVHIKADLSIQLIERESIAAPRE